MPVSTMLSDHPETTSPGVRSPLFTKSPVRSRGKSVVPMAQRTVYLI
jgi:hypothetical protein